MDASKISYGTRRLLTLHPIDICINLTGAAITFAWFSQIQPGLTGVGDFVALRDRAIFIIVLIVTVLGIGLPLEFRWFWPLVKQFKMLGRKFNLKKLGPVEQQELSEFTGKILNVPIRMSATNLGAWLVSGVIFTIVPHTFPEYCPWDAASAAKISVWTVFLGAPIAVTFSYFVGESWIRTTVREVFPAELLLTQPRSVRISTLSRLLVVSLMIGIIPPVVISHITLHQITEIQKGHQSIDSFLAQMPMAIGFLVTVFCIIAVSLSILLARSVSEPLRKTGSAMRRIGRGDLDASIKVVSNDEIGVVGEGFNNMVEGLRERDYIRETFGRYLSQEVVTEILQSPEGVKLGGELRNITILVSDLRGFTKLSESLEPQTVIEILNRYFEKMTDVIIHHRGTIDEFTGDGILVFFGAPKAIPDHARVAVTCALDMQKALEELNKENLLLNWPELRMGIGVNSGEVVVGNLGSEKRKKYGAVGSPINVAFRVEGLAGAGETLLTPSVYGETSSSLELGGIIEAQLKGFDKPIILYRVVALRDA